MNDVADKFNADFTVDLGDVGIDVPLKSSDEMRELTQLLLKYRNLSKRRPAIFAKGNHDVKLKGFPKDFWERSFHEINAGAAMTYGGDGSYGFFDIRGKNTRIFWLNTSECKGHLTDTQLDFLKKHLNSLPKDHCAVVLNHVSSHEIIGRGVRRRFLPLPVPLEKLNWILKNFVKKGGRLVGSFSEHCHYNADAREDGVNYFILQGYGGIGPNQNPPYARVTQEFNPKLGRTDTFDMTKHTMIHLVVIKPKLGEMKIFRIRAGSILLLSVCCSRKSQEMKILSA